jgi:hypothetical protein
MTLDDRVAALGFLGLTPRQTRFVAIVALHGGYCLRRQYATFAGLTYGASVRDFLDDLVHRRLISRVEYRHDRGFVYHLRAKHIYRAIAQDDNRNRRHVSPALIARKLMLLDVVLAHPDAIGFATEQDKVALFNERFGVPLADLPQRVYFATSTNSLASATTRYFVNKWPIFLSGEGEQGPQPRVTFVALVVESTGQTFKHFLADHSRLLRRLSSWTILAACPAGHAGLTACRVVFDRTFSRPIASTASPTHSSQSPSRLSELTLSPDLARYFATRRALDTGDVASVSVADLDHYRDARIRFFGPAVDRAYARWRVHPSLEHGPARGADAGSGPCLRPGSGPATDTPVAGTAGEFQPYVLPFTYQQFGDFAGEC